MEKQKLPFAKKSLTFGIISIVTACCCWGIPGVILGYIGLQNSKKAKALYEENPDLYDGLGNADTGKITSIIGLALGGLLTINLIYSLVTGSFYESIDLIKEAIEQAQQNQ